jgi:hypothetical protein
MPPSSCVPRRWHREDCRLNGLLRLNSTGRYPYGVALTFFDIRHLLGIPSRTPNSQCL